MTVELEEESILEQLGIQSWRLTEHGLNADALLAEPDIAAGLNWDELRNCVKQCTACELHQSRTQTVFGVGNQQAELFIIGEAPGYHEDQQGEPFVGRAGSLLNEMLKAIGLAREDIFIANILKCRPPNNRDPRPEEATQCRGYLDQQIALVQPKLILTIGRIAAQSLLNQTVPLSHLRGHEHSYKDIPVLVSYHPAYLLRNPKDKKRAFTDWQWVCRKINDT